MEWDNFLLGPLPYLWLCRGTRWSQDRGRQDPPATSQCDPGTQELLKGSLRGGWEDRRRKEGRGRWK